MSARTVVFRIIAACLSLSMLTFAGVLVYLGVA